jgi:mitogen-activated protein kinase 1/3
MADKTVAMFELSTNVFNVEAALVGQGAYGAVCRATVKKNNHPVAIKRIPHYNKNLDTAKKILREMVILRHLSPCTQIVKGHIFFRSQREKSLYIVMDYLPSDLSTVIKQGKLSEEAKIRYVTAQLLLGVGAMHKAGCTHRDLSTRNILVNENCEIRIADFGLARFFDPEEQMSFGVVTQWYRAPEIVTDASYNAKVDVWSVGVIMAELFLQGHIFAGKPNDLADQLNKIMRIVGIPEAGWFTDPNCVLSTSSENAKRYVQRVCQSAQMASADPVAAANFRPTLFTATGPQFKIPLSDDAKDLLGQLIRFNPDMRPNAEQALAHRWFDPLREYIDYYRADVPLLQHKLLTQRAGNGVTAEELNDLDLHVRFIEDMAPVWSDALEGPLIESLEAAAEEDEDEDDEDAAQ